MEDINILLIGRCLSYNLEEYVRMALEKLGHQVTFLGYQAMTGPLTHAIEMAIVRSATAKRVIAPLFLRKFNVKVKEEGKKLEPDLLLSIKGESVLPSTIDWIRDELGVKVSLWYPDDPLYFNSFTKYIAPHYDYVFTASERAIPLYQKIGVKNVGFLPFACEPSIHKKIYSSEKGKRKYESDICFIGTWYPRRMRIIDKLDGFDIKIYGPYWRLFRRGVHDGLWGPDMVKVFNNSKIVLDIYDRHILSYEVNMRTFEATGSGAFLLTERAYGLEKLFTIGKELICYNGDKEFVELTEYYLESEDERMEISAKGQRRAYKEHTYTMRVKELFTKIN